MYCFSSAKDMRCFSPGFEATGPRIDASGKRTTAICQVFFSFRRDRIIDSQGYLGKEPETKHRNVDLWFFGETAEHFILVVHFLVNRKECCEVEEQIAYAKRRFYTQRLMSRAFHHSKES